MLNNVKNALTRKLGPLPAWAWLGILAVSVYLFRRSRGGTPTIATSDADTTSPDATAAAEPVVLQPGESAYNPATGQLVSTAPEQQPGNTPESTGPIVAGPGESIYDPATGAYYPSQPETSDQTTDTPVSTGTAKGKPTALQRAKAVVARGGNIGPKNRQRLRHAGYSDAQIAYHRKRKTPLGTPASKKHPKPKTQHKPPKPVPRHAKKPSPKRGTGTVKHPTPRSHHKTPAPRARHTPARVRAITPRPGNTTTRSRPAARPAPVIRQRPAPAPTRHKPRRHR